MQFTLVIATLPYLLPSLSHPYYYTHTTLPTPVLTCFPLRPGKLHQGYPHDHWFGAIHWIILR